MNEITVENLYWKPDSATHPITNRISTQFTKGRFIGILGPNGSGKTSFARQLLHLLKSDDGRIFYDETNIAKLSRKQIAKNIAFLPQNTQVDAEFTVYDIVAMGRTPHKSKFENHYIFFVIQLYVGLLFDLLLHKGCKQQFLLCIRHLKVDRGLRKHHLL